MSEQERRQKFAAAVQAAAEQYGITMDAMIQLPGDPVLSNIITTMMLAGKLSSSVQIQAVPNWLPPVIAPTPPKAGESS